MQIAIQITNRNEQWIDARVVHHIGWEGRVAVVDQNRNASLVADRCYDIKV